MENNKPKGNEPEKAKHIFSKICTKKNAGLLLLLVVILIVLYLSISKSDSKTPVAPVAKPTVANTPYPPDGGGYMPVDVDLTWSPGINAESHNVYFGTIDPPPFIDNQMSTTFEPGVLDRNATYYWRIDEVGAGGTTTGPVWSFWTIKDTATVLE